MKKAASAIRLELAQYREMEVFTQFASDLDEMTKRQLVYGQGLMQLLKQEQYHPLKQSEQVILLVAALAHVMQDVPVQKITEFKHGLLKYVQKHLAAECEAIEKGGQLLDETKNMIIETAKKYLEVWKSE